jgi:hypothetical protein
MTATMVRPTPGFPAPKTAVATAIASQDITGTAAFVLGNTDGYCIPVNGVASFALEWVKGSGTSLVVAPFVSIDGVTWQPLPSYASASAGQSVASPASVTFSSVTWLRSGSSTVVDCPVSFNCGGWAFVKLVVTSNHASGSISGNVGAGIAQ